MMRTVCGALGIAIALSFAPEAGARELQAEGFWQYRRAPALLPAQASTTPIGGGLGFPNDDLMGVGLVGAMGMSPAQLTLPQHFVTGSYSALLPLRGTKNVQLTTMLTVVRGPALPGGAVFSAGGGPGNFTWCPGTPPGGAGAACPAPPAPPQGTGTRPGRIIYQGGGFGGVAQLTLAGAMHSTITRPGFGFGSPIFQARHSTLALPASGLLLPVGGPFGATSMETQAPSVYTQPKTAPATTAAISGMQGGPLVTSLGALTSCPSTGGGGSYPNIPLMGSNACVTGVGPPLLPPGAMTTGTGFSFTTGTVIAECTTGPGAGAFTLTGSDNRTPFGVGNITLVAGGLVTRDYNNGLVCIGCSGSTIRLTLSQKVPGISSAGLLAAATLMVIIVGYTKRRTF